MVDYVLQSMCRPALVAVGATQCLTSDTVTADVHQSGRSVFREYKLPEKCLQSGELPVLHRLHPCVRVTVYKAASNRLSASVSASQLAIAQHRHQSPALRVNLQTACRITLSTAAVTVRAVGVLGQSKLDPAPDCIVPHCETW